MSSPFLVIFDCDGTLIDSQYRIGASMAEAYRACGLEAPTTAHTRTVIGMSLDAAIMRLSPELEIVKIHEIATAYKNAFMHFRSNNLHDEPMFEGARDALNWLAGKDNVLMGVATGKSRRGLDSVLEREQLRNHFVTLQTADDAPSKPHPGMINNALSETGASVERCIVIGDTSFDMEMAVNAGVRGLGVSWGYHAPEYLRQTGAYHVLETYDELPAALEPLIAGEMA